ncbi:SDR family NAD(P)-dependent oxidoreductase [Methylocella tundrae]|uniref:3-oxoacyl-ACP reductase n=1 Tax=Methylocella tundrae TaxID=227605 RepID=A0A4U8Z2T9_METTU|nr:SDR family NAD(P)-dependent oxidoreductase [Methylocella tundrae]WPP03582.1 SDR family oxidoreductase [Methylocella tundrae]VFU09693.1 3-oxoacyl-ACP reductase [Methylocella tundrae]
MPKSSKTLPTALIVGASRGLGFAIAQTYLERGWRVIATVRGKARTALHDLAAKAEGLLEVETLDIAVPAEVAALRKRLAGRRLDLLFVNAGVLDEPVKTIADISTEEFNRIMVTNALSPLRVIEALEELVPPAGTIGVMSSGLGSVANNTNGGYETYRASKAALNTLMRSFAARHARDLRALLIMDPGWVRTDMGGPDAQLSVEESIPSLVDVITAQSGKKGLQYLDYRGRTVAW